MGREYNAHEVACLLAEVAGDDCACNVNGNDEWLPNYCEFADTLCPNPGGVTCWIQYLNHYWHKEEKEAVGVDEMPTVDSVEVVRCRECKYHNLPPCPMRLSFNWTEDNDFCSYGERKGGADNER